MKNKQTTLHYSMDKNPLKSIGGIEFTPRQIDMMACFLSRQKSKSIAAFLSITLKTFETHTHAIMQKLGCSSREEVITHIKKSGKSSLIQKHHHILLTQSLFEKCLQKISALVGQKGLKCYLAVDSQKNEFDFFMTILKSDLKMAHITVLKEAANFTPVIFLSLGKSPSFCSENDFSLKDCVIFESPETYYFSVFDILKKLLPCKKIEAVYEEFKKQYSILQKEFGSSTSSLSLFSTLTNHLSQKRFIINFLKKRILFFSFLAIFGIIFSIGYFTYKKNRGQELVSARSSLVIPTENSFLNRSGVIAQIKEKLNRKTLGQIPLVGIIGIGGSGKTILARHYARSLNTAVVWEVNAATHNSLFTSFNNLSYILAQTKEQRDTLNFIQTLQNSDEKEEQIFSFIKNSLKKINKWVLIYDNIENFSEIKKYIPQDSQTWGHGKVIITTRDSNVKNTGYIPPENTIEIKELETAEALTLFSKILYNHDLHKLNPSQKKEALDFLKNIPPFPLDVSIAAYYIKNENLTFGQYIERINDSYKDLEIVQESLLREVSDYTKTRSKTITIPLEKSIKRNPEFKELLFLICLLDSQNIPKELLEMYKPKTSIDRFLRDLRGNGLIKSESKDSLENSCQSTFSLHFSTQSISFDFLKNALTEEERICFIKRIIKAVTSYYDLYEPQDYKKIEVLLPHIRTLIRNLKKMPSSEKWPGTSEKDFLEKFKVITDRYPF